MSFCETGVEVSWRTSTRRVPFYPKKTITNRYKTKTRTDLKRMGLFLSAPSTHWVEQIQARGFLSCMKGFIPPGPCSKEHSNTQCSERGTGV